MTDNEYDVLFALLSSEYHDGRDPIGDPIWVDCVMEPFGTSAGGIMASLVRKGWVRTDGEVCSITAAGAAAFATR